MQNRHPADMQASRLQLERHLSAPADRASRIRQEHPVESRLGIPPKVARALIRGSAPLEPSATVSVDRATLVKLLPSHQAAPRMALLPAWHAAHSVCLYTRECPVRGRCLLRAAS